MNPAPRQIAYEGKGGIICCVVVDEVGQIVEKVQELDESEEEADVGDSEDVGGGGAGLGGYGVGGGGFGGCWWWEDKGGYDWWGWGLWWRSIERVEDDIDI